MYSKLKYFCFSLCVCVFSENLLCFYVSFPTVILDKIWLPNVWLGLALVHGSCHALVTKLKLSTKRVRITGVNFIRIILCAYAQGRVMKYV